MNTTAKSAKPAKPAKTPKPAKVYVSFLKEAPGSILSSNGLLTVADPAAHGYDREKHERLNADDFEGDGLWLKFRVSDLRSRAAEMTKKADRLERDAENAMKFGDPVARASAKKLQKLTTAAALLAEELKKQGVDVNALLAAVGAGPSS